MMTLNNHFKFAKKMAVLMDTRFSLFGFKFGVDPLLDLVPALGSVVGGVTSLYLFWIALQLNVGKRVYFKMLFNILVDFILGEIPVVGIIFDIFYKSNIKNIKILEKFITSDVLEGEIIK